jgi:hypothetical protein
MCWPKTVAKVGVESTSWGDARKDWQRDRTKNNTRQLHESFVIKWMCKYECRTHRERSFVMKN